MFRVLGFFFNPVDLGGALLCSLGENEDNEAERAERLPAVTVLSTFPTAAAVSSWFHHFPTILSTILLILGAELLQRDCVWFKINTVYLGHKHEGRVGSCGGCFLGLFSWF